ncbi:SLP1 Uncharacterized protein SLP1 [Candida maltosa Xu316]
MRYLWHVLLNTLYFSTTVHSSDSNHSDNTEVSKKNSNLTPVTQFIPVFIIPDPNVNKSDDLFLKSPATLQPKENEDLPTKNDSVLDECHFMSFEEWKKHKIIESNNATDFNQSTDNNEPELVNATYNNSIIAPSNITTLGEAEGKVYKDKFNFASVDCAATIVKTNAKAKGASAILKENKDSYLLNECSIPNKYVIIELCQDILVDSVVIGNFEFFSSMFKDIKISVSDRFPTQNWKELGEFTAENIRDVQSFKIQNPLIWARYLKLEILSHYGNEFYCPLSVVRVHGKTMMDEFKEEEESSFQAQEKQEIPQKLEKDELLLINQSSINECRVVLPHLQLNEFLKDFNATAEEFCIPADQEYSSSTASSQTTSIVTTQESIYKNIMKRLSLLESNATLSLLYIEEQSKLLSTAFSNLEKRQTNNFNSLINSVNVTLVHQLVSFKESYNTLHEQYNQLFKIQENGYKQLLLETNKKIGYLTNELTFQKRVSIFNSIIIICLLVYVILTRDVKIDGRETYENAKEPSSANKLLSSPFISKKQKKTS